MVHVFDPFSKSVNTEEQSHGPVKTKPERMFFHGQVFLWYKCFNFTIESLSRNCCIYSVNITEHSKIRIKTCSQKRLQYILYWLLSKKTAAVIII